MTHAGDKLPDFIIIGAMKSGTTTLWQYLTRHPDVFMVDSKEPNFFSDEGKYALGPDWYRALFAEAGPGQICGEASTDYTRWPAYGDVAARVAALLPDVRLIYLLRNPIERAYSQYAFKYRMRTLEETPPFDEAVKTDTNLLDTSLYMRQLQQYLTHYDSSRFLVILFEEMTADPERVLREVQRFLGVAPVDLHGTGPIAANVAGDQVLRRTVRDRMERIPGVSAGARLLPGVVKRNLYRVLSRSKMSKRVVAQHAAPPLSAEMRRDLARYFEGPNQELADFLGRDLSVWST